MSEGVETTGNDKGETKSTADPVNTLEIKLQKTEQPGENNEVFEQSLKTLTKLVKQNSLHQRQLLH